jgi:uncharacterized membrane protein
MNISEENEIKKEFQLERLIFFSDAVFAIIITIMILDVKLPEELIHPSETESKKAFIHILPKLIAYGISFFVIGSFWMRHLRVFSFLKDYNMQLIALNLLFLFSVSLFPFALSFSFSSSSILQYTWGVYTYMGIIYLAFFTQALLIGYLVRNRDTLCLHAEKMPIALKWRVRKIGLYMLPLFFVMIIAAGFFNINTYYLFGVLMAYGIVIGRLKKKWYPHDAEDRVTIRSFFRKANERIPVHKRVHK